MIHVCEAESLCCIPETSTTLLTSYTPLQSKKFEKKKNRLVTWPSTEPIIRDQKSFLYSFPFPYINLFMAPGVDENLYQNTSWTQAPETRIQRPHMIENTDVTKNSSETNIHRAK